MKLITDAYHGDGSPDWAKVKAAGVSGVWLKASDGTHDWSAWAKPQAAAAAKAGLEVGLYHWVQPLQDAKAQMQLVAHLLDTIPFTHTLGVMLDIEPTMQRNHDLWDSVGASGAAKIATQVISLLPDPSKGIQCLVYSNALWWNQRLVGKADHATQASLQSVIAARQVQAVASRYPFTTYHPFTAAQYRGHQPEQMKLLPPNRYWQFTENADLPGFGHADLTVDMTTAGL